TQSDVFVDFGRADRDPLFRLFDREKVHLFCTPCFANIVPTWEGTRRGARGSAKFFCGRMRMAQRLDGRAGARQIGASHER
ncbi:MAG: hypothetical protein M0Z28_20630, partial [Rhodospirillales bacterium]|nr:hypothetical protein [Rhodospirillales bacterium]